MRTLKITGGPSVKTIKIVDSETGVDLTPVFLRLQIVAKGNGDLLRVHLEAFVELDIVADEVESGINLEH